MTLFGRLHGQNEGENCCGENAQQKRFSPDEIQSGQGMGEECLIREGDVEKGGEPAQQRENRAQEWNDRIIEPRFGLFGRRHQRR